MLTGKILKTVPLKRESKFYKEFRRQIAEGIKYFWKLLV